MAYIQTSILQKMSVPPAFERPRSVTRTLNISALGQSLWRSAGQCRFRRHEGAKMAYGKISILQRDVRSASL